ncbi:response regulator [Pyxidicoccus sp. 3LG]
MVVDDDVDVRESVSQALEDLDYPIVTATNGREALDLLRELTSAPRVILLDLMMPVMNGWQFLEERQKDAALVAIPVVVMTATADETVWAMHVSLLLRKPVSYEQLVEAVKRAS